ncbi:MAG: helix-turn-helix transcriptional regulator [Clostridiales bacterium]|nr:helix-turn-helix transcriptional regulator [Clostridiales bacterium]
MTNFGFNIKKLRESKGLSLSDVEKKLGITKGLISRYENNLVDPSLSVAAKFAEFYSVSLDYLVGLK